MFSTFQIAGSEIHSYNILMLIGFILGVLYLERLLSQLKLDETAQTKIRLFVPLGILLGLFGAAILDTLLVQSSFSIYTLNRGLTFYGGLILGVVFLFLYAKFQQLEARFLLDLFAAPFVLGHVFGRIGCFLAGCCHGVPTPTSLGVHFPIDSLAFEEYGNLAVHPTQLYESVGLFLLFLVLHRSPLNYRFLVYALGYGILRFLIEFLRGDTRGNLLSIEVLSPSQVISFLLIGVGLLTFLYRRKPTFNQTIN